MKLYEVPRNSKIRLLVDSPVPPAHRDVTAGEVLDFHHVDGMYSLCFDKDGNPVHVAAWALVEIVEDENS